MDRRPHKLEMAWPYRDQKPEIGFSWDRIHERFVFSFSLHPQYIKILRTVISIRIFLPRNYLNFAQNWLNTEIVNGEVPNCLLKIFEKFPLKNSQSPEKGFLLHFQKAKIFTRKTDWVYLSKNPVNKNPDGLFPQMLRLTREIRFLFPGRGSWGGRLWGTCRSRATRRRSSRRRTSPRSRCCSRSLLSHSEYFFQDFFHFY